MANTEETTRRPMLPGYGLPLDDENPLKKGLDGLYSESTMFPTALDSYDNEFGPRRLTTWREIKMMEFMDMITNKNDWEEKVFNPEITAKWTREVLESTDRDDMTETTAEYCIAELKLRVPHFKKHGFTIAFDGDVVKSDIAVSKETNEALREAVKALEDVPESEKDWHPGSHGLVLDLVHPSLFPLVYERSRVLKENGVQLQNCLDLVGTGDTIPEADTKYHKGSEYSTKFQWLPCDVSLADGEAKITSYINNLHPVHHGALYPLIERLIDAAIPLWNATLTTSDSLPPRIEYLEIKFDEPADYDADSIDSDDPRYPQEEEEEDEYEYQRRFDEWTEEHGPTLALPEPDLKAVRKPIDDPEHMVDLIRDYDGLQIIVKLANIVLTPENPKYGGGSWHVEGQKNEHICATAIYYYDSENITRSELSFRQYSTQENIEAMHYAPVNNDRGSRMHRWLPTVFNLSKDSIQKIGSVSCDEGRLVTFPNTLQHCVKPFELDDKAKPGHRKIVALFLVDPHVKVISTSMVPPQRKDWGAQRNIDQVLEKLPQELKDEVLSYTMDWSMDLDEAKQLRLQLMEERKVYVQDYDKRLTEMRFSLCEH